MTPQERAALIKDISEALNIEYAGAKLTGEEVSYVRLAIQKEAQSIKLRQAIIEKSLAGLVWAFLLFTGTVILEYAKNHGWK